MKKIAQITRHVVSGSSWHPRPRMRARAYEIEIIVREHNAPDRAPRHGLRLARACDNKQLNKALG